MNLVPAIKEMQSALAQERQEHVKKMNELQEGLAALRKLNTICEKCGGKKTIQRPRSCAEDDMTREHIQCPQCGGSGTA